MADTAGTEGQAHPPTVVAANDVGALQAAIAAAIEQQAREQADTEDDRNIASLEAGIDKLHEHLEHHKELLAAAKAAKKERLKEAKAARHAEEMKTEADEDVVHDGDRVDYAALERAAQRQEGNA